MDSGEWLAASSSSAIRAHRDAWDLFNTKTSYYLPYPYPFTELIAAAEAREVIQNAELLKVELVERAAMMEAADG